MAIRVTVSGYPAGAYWWVPTIENAEGYPVAGLQPLAIPDNLVFDLPNFDPTGLWLRPNFYVALNGTPFPPNQTFPASGGLTNNRAYRLDYSVPEIATLVDIGPYSGGGGSVPTINSFTATPYVVPSGNNTTLAWSTSNATVVSVNAGLGEISQPINGSLTLGPLYQNTTVVLTATNAYGMTTSTIFITIQQAASVAITSFTGNGLSDEVSIANGGIVSVAWSTTGAQQVTFQIGQQGVQSVALNGSTGAGPFTQDITLYLVAQGADGTIVTRTINVTIASGNAPTITSFTATPSSVESGGSSLLSWSISGATSATLKAGSYIGIDVDAASGTKGATGLTQTVIYTLTATNTYGSVTQSVTVTVTSSPTTGGVPTWAIAAIAVAAVLALILGRKKQ
jgi:hypothetical protein